MVVIWKFGVRRILLWGLCLAALVFLFRRHPQHEEFVQLVRPADAQAAQMAHKAVQQRFREDMLLIQRTLKAWPEGKPKAAVFVLARNNEADELVQSLQELEASFNGKEEARYPYVIVNDQEFTADFIRTVESGLLGRCFFGQVPAEHWSYPPHVNASTAAAARAAQGRANVLYGTMESYHFMCRYYSGYFMHHPLMAGFDFYWRVEPGVRFYCDLEADPFVTLRDTGAVYGWNIVREELMNTVPNLWPTFIRILHEHPDLLHPRNALRAMAPQFQGLSEQGPKATLLAAPYSGCHYWSNFEIGALKFFRDKPYQTLFAELDATGGFFLERWGDAPVHSIAVAALTDGRAAIHHFDDIGYRHGDALHCPQNRNLTRRCTCLPAADYNQHEARCSNMQREGGLIL